MSESQKQANLNQLVREAHQGVVQQQEATAALVGKGASQSSIKSMLGYLLLMVFIVVAVIQYPRINTPYAWPDTDASPAAAEAELEAVVGVIETYRVSQGQYPTALSHVRFPDGMAPEGEGSQLTYLPSEKGYLLAWTRPHWLATYQSDTGKISVEPQGKR